MLGSADIFGMFDSKTKKILRSAGTIAALRGHDDIDTYHFLLAWLQETGFSPGDVSASCYDAGMDYLVRRSSAISQASHVSPILLSCLYAAINDSFPYYEHPVTYKWIIPNLLFGRGAAAQLIEFVGHDIFRFLDETLQFLGPPFPGFNYYYKNKLDLDYAKSAMARLHHRSK